MAVRRKKIQALASELLEKAKISASAVPIEEIISQSGAQIFKAPVAAELSGYIARSEDSDNVVIGVNANHSDTRQRFTLAHELGHLLLHTGYQIHLDRQDGDRTAFYINLRHSVPTEGTEDEEREANLFAAELLMPRYFLLRDLEDLGPNDLLDESLAISNLADKYKVSTTAMTYRLINLGALKDN